MSDPTWVTVTEAVYYTDRSKTVIYDLIRSDTVRIKESTRGNLVDLTHLRAILSERRPGRPRGSTNRP